MHPWRDVLATLLVAFSVVIYGMWALGAPLATFSDVPAIAVAVLVLGVAASVSAVVPGFDELLQGSRRYLGVASALGVVALGAGVWAFAAAEPATLAVLVLATIAMWALSTVRHLGLAFGQPRTGRA
jgi:hypothetical protein